jgi:hypothetical protein
MAGDPPIKGGLIDGNVRDVCKSFLTFETKHNI